MTEPVAYLNKYLDGSTDITRFKPINEADVVILSSNVIVSSTPLYTADQLHQRVKMTQAELDEFKLLYNLFNGSTVRGIINTVENNESKRFTNLKSRLNKTGKDLEIIILWSIYNPDEPEETIEIVPNMKWFVRSKKRDDEGYYLFLSGSNLDDLEYFGFDYAMAFDTKEQAELWLNPLTEAVQLAVEGEL